MATSEIKDITWAKSVRSYPSGTPSALYAYNRLDDYFSPLRLLLAPVDNVPDKYGPALISQRVRARDAILVVLTQRKYPNGASSELSLVGKNRLAVEGLRVSVNCFLGSELGDLVEDISLTVLKGKIFIVGGALDVLLRRIS